jgi:hypothetical protein
MPWVPQVKQRASRFNPTVIWEHPCEQHIGADGKITEKYRIWRKKLSNNKVPVRYPFGFSGRHNPNQFALVEDAKTGEILQDRKLDYVTARKEIYFPLYLESVKNHPMFLNLKKRLDAGSDLLVVEIDGPHQESLEYYMEKYKVPKNWIENSTMLVTKESLKIMIEDTKHPAGHCLALAMALLGLSVADIEAPPAELVSIPSFSSSSSSSNSVERDE